MNEGANIDYTVEVRHLALLSDFVLFSVDLIEPVLFLHHLHSV